MIDINHDGCVTKDEMRKAKKAMHRHPKPMVPAEQPMPIEEPAVVDAIAPVMED